MKARVLFICLAAMALLVLAFGMPGAAQAQAAGLCGAYVIQNGGVFTVTPNGLDDTAALQCAIDQATAYGPGAVVQLAAGDFHTSFLKARGFNGVFKGMGMGETFLIALDDLRCDLEFAQGIYPRLITFTTEKTRLSDLTIQVPDQTPCVLPLDGEGNPYNPYGQGNSLGMAVSFSAPFEDSCDVNEIGYTNVVVDSLAIEGRWGEFPYPDYYGVNLVHGVVFGSDSACPSAVYAHSGGSFKLTRSRVTHAALPVFVVDLKDARVQLGGSPKLANTFAEMGHVYMLSNIDTLAEVSYNLFDNVYWEAMTLWVMEPNEWQLLVDEPSNYQVHHNTINLTAGSTGFYIEDYNIYNGLPAGMRASITDNRINFNGFYHWGVWAPYTENFILANNIFTGPAFIGAWIGEYGYQGEEEWITARNWLIKNNNVDAATFELAHYRLTNTSSNNVVIGTGQEVVIDEGKHNVIKNVLEPETLAQGSRPSGPKAPPKAHWK